MAARCDLTNKGLISGHKVSHSQIKTNRVFKPNLQNVSFYSGILKSNINVRVASNTIRTVDHNGGIDSFLLNSSNRKLSDKAIVIKKRLLKAQEKQAAN